jgi:hypothetical protein
MWIFRTSSNSTTKSYSSSSFKNQQAKLQGAGGASNTLANTYDKEAERERQKWANVGAGAGRVLGGM